MRYYIIYVIIATIAIACSGIVSGADNYDCTIYDAKISLNPNVGSTVFATGTLRNNETNNTIVNSNCRLYLTDPGGRVVSFSEEGRTMDNGVILVKNVFNAGVVTANTTYTATISCFCVGNYTTADTTRPGGGSITSLHDVCYEDGNGRSIARRACSTSVTLTTGWNYFVPENYGAILAAIILIPCFFAIAFGITGALIDIKLWILKYLFVFFQFIFLVIAGYFGTVAVLGRNVNEVLDSMAYSTMAATYTLVALVVILAIVLSVIWIKTLKNWKKLKMEY